MSNITNNQPQEIIIRNGYYKQSLQPSKSGLDSMREMGSDDIMFIMLGVFLFTVILAIAVYTLTESKK